MHSLWNTCHVLLGNGYMIVRVSVNSWLTDMLTMLALHKQLHSYMQPTRRPQPTPDYLTYE